mmetsp:Transcript_7141/g.14318  ORF Transcript_7141/g.14318 Transcript_7141/m.14318 type:complete len:218 (-) Transcript_7141:73-726(-)
MWMRRYTWTSRGISNGLTSSCCAPSVFSHDEALNPKLVQTHLEILMVLDSNHAHVRRPDTGPFLEEVLHSLTTQRTQDNKLTLRNVKDECAVLVRTVHTLRPQHRLIQRNLVGPFSSSGRGVRERKCDKRRCCAPGICFSNSYPALHIVCFLEKLHNAERCRSPQPTCSSVEIPSRFGPTSLSHSSRLSLRESKGGRFCLLRPEFRNRRGLLCCEPR